MHISHRRWYSYIFYALFDAKSHFNRWKHTKTIKFSKEDWGFIQSQKGDTWIFKSKLRHFKILPVPTNQVRKCWISKVNMLCTGTRQASTRDSLTKYKNMYLLHTSHENLGMLSVAQWQQRFLCLLVTLYFNVSALGQHQSLSWRFILLLAVVHDGLWCPLCTEDRSDSQKVGSLENLGGCTWESSPGLFSPDLVSLTLILWLSAPSFAHW